MENLLCAEVHTRLWIALAERHKHHSYGLLIQSKVVFLKVEL